MFCFISKVINVSASLWAISKHSLHFQLYAVALVLALSFPTKSSAQNNTVHQALYWTRYQNQILFNDHISWYNEIDNRRFFHPSIQNQLIAHTHVHYTFKHFEPAVGCSLSWIYAQNPDVGYTIVIPEIRPFQELTYTLPITKKLKLHERFRIDDRFIRNHTSTELTDGYQFTFRFRLRTQLSYKFENQWTLKVSDEIMLNDRRNTFDQNRVFASIDIPLSKNFSVEAGYIRINQRRMTTMGYYDRDVMRLSIQHRLYLKKA